MKTFVASVTGALLVKYTLMALSAAYAGERWHLRRALRRGRRNVRAHRGGRQGLAVGAVRRLGRVPGQGQRRRGPELEPVRRQRVPDVVALRGEGGQ